MGISAETIARWHESEADKALRHAEQTRLRLRRQRFLAAARMHRDCAKLVRLHLEHRQ